MLIRLGRECLPRVAELLKDSRAARLFGSEEATMAHTYQIPSGGFRVPLRDANTTATAGVYYGVGSSAASYGSVVGGVTEDGRAIDAQFAGRGDQQSAIPTRTTACGPARSITWAETSPPLSRWPLACRARPLRRSSTTGWHAAQPDTHPSVCPTSLRMFLCEGVCHTHISFHLHSSSQQNSKLLGGPPRRPWANSGSGMASQSSSEAGRN